MPAPAEGESSSEYVTFGMKYMEIDVLAMTES